METPIPSPASSETLPEPSASAAGTPAAQPVPAAGLTAGDGPSLSSVSTPGAVASSHIAGGGFSMDESSPTTSEALKHLSETVLMLAKSHDSHGDSIDTLTDRLTAVQSHLADLDTPQNAAAVNVVLEGLTKPGNRTTEFWLTFIAALGVLGLAVGQIIPGETAAWVLLVSSAIYTLARMALKGKAADLANNLLPVVFGVFCLTSMSGCAWITAHQAQINATGSVVGKRALAFAEQTLLAAAVSEADSGFKANYLDAIASGLRANEGNIVTSDDVAQIVTIWSPNDGAAWKSLAGGVAQIADQALVAADKPQAAAVIEQIATGLNAAAAKGRTAATTTGTAN